MASLVAGDVLVMNWRGGGLPKEANKVRPCVIVEDADLFSEEHANLIVVPLTTRAATVISKLSVSISPTRENGLDRLSFAPAYLVTAASKQRTDGEPIGRITLAQLRAIREYIAEAVGIS